MTSSPGDLIGRSGARFFQISSTALACALAITREERLPRLAAREFIGLGQDRALARRLFNVADQHVVIAQTLDNLIARQPLGNREGVKDDLAGEELRLDLAHADAGA